MGPTNRVLVLTADTIGPAMAGPGIRSYEFARALSSSCTVTLASTQPVELPIPGCSTASFADRRELQELVNHHDVIVGISGLLAQHTWLAASGKVIVADAYDPVLLEVLEWFSTAPPEERDAHARVALQRMTGALRFADVVLCASDRQRLLLIGVLLALGRVNPANYEHDPSLESLVRVVPFGLPAEPPQRQGSPPLRGEDGPFSQDDFVLLWGGGLHQWLDPMTLLEAVALIDDPSVKAAFLAGGHPTPGVPGMPVADQARGRAAELGLLGSRVVFVDQWVEYRDRADYLLEADAGVSLHQNHVEATFAFRTRMLDYLWAGLPVICSAGDSLAELVSGRGLGVVVAPDDPGALAAGVGRLRGDRYDACRRAVRKTAEEFTWDRVTQPLVDFCCAPAQAPDRLANRRPRINELVLRAARRSREVAHHALTRNDTK